MTRSSCFAPVFLLLITGCADLSPVTDSEARETLQEMVGANEALNVTAALVEVSTIAAFSLGDDSEATASGIAGMVGPLIPCTMITQDGGSLDIVYASNTESCTWKEHAFESGEHRIDVERNDDTEAVILHTFDALTTADIEVSGTARVTYDGNIVVASELSWEQRFAGRPVASGTFDMKQVPSSTTLEGVLLEGSGSWEGKDGAFELETDGMDARWGEAVPASGGCFVGTPFNVHRVELSFFGHNEGYQEVLITTNDSFFNMDVIDGVAEVVSQEAKN